MKEKNLKIAGKVRVQSLKPVQIRDIRKWRVKFTLDGKKHQRDFDTEGLAKSFIQDLGAFVLGRRKVSTSQGTEAQLGRVFFEMINLELSLGSISESTATTYWNWFKCYFEEHYKTTCLHHIDNDWVARLKDELNKNSNGTRYKSALVLLKKVKSYVQNRNNGSEAYILNIVANVEKLKSEVKRKNTIQSYSYEEYKKIVIAFHETKDEDFKYKLAAVLLGLNTACRIGEFLTLRWHDYDKEKKTITVARTVQKSLNGQKVGEPKSNRKTIAVTPILEAVLQYLEESYPPQSINDFIIVPRIKLKTKTLTAVSGPTVRRWLIQISEELDLPYLSCHKAWRKTIATIIATTTKGKNPFEVAKFISNLLGHSEGSTTALNVYVVPVIQDASQFNDIMNVSEETDRFK